MEPTPEECYRVAEYALHEMLDAAKLGGGPFAVRLDLGDRVADSRHVGNGFPVGEIAAGGLRAAFENVSRQ